MKWLLFSLLCFLCCLNPSIAFLEDQNDFSNDFGNRIVYLEAPSFHKCIVFSPVILDKMKPYKLIMGLHGRYADAEYAMSLIKQLGLNKSDFVYATLRGPYHEGEKDKYSWAISEPSACLILPFRSLKEGKNGKISFQVSEHKTDSIWRESKDLSQKYIEKTVRELRKAYNIDPKEIYLLGHSQGAAMAYGAGIKNHELFKGIIILSGWLDPDWITDDEIKNAKSLKVFIAHGKNDDNVKFTRSIEAQDILKKHGYDVTFYEYDGGHGPQEDEFKAAGKWLMQNISADEKGK